MPGSWMSLPYTSSPVTFCAASCTGYVCPTYCRSSVNLSPRVLWSGVGCGRLGNVSGAGLRCDPPAADAQIRLAGGRSSGLLSANHCSKSARQRCAAGAAQAPPAEVQSSSGGRLRPMPSATSMASCSGSTASCPASARSANTCAMQVAAMMRLRHGWHMPPGMGSHGMPVKAWSASEAAFSPCSGEPPTISVMAAAAMAPQVPASPAQQIVLAQTAGVLHGAHGGVDVAGAAAHGARHHDDAGDAGAGPVGPLDGLRRDPVGHGPARRGMLGPAAGEVGLERAGGDDEVLLVHGARLPAHEAGQHAHAVDDPGARPPRGVHLVLDGYLPQRQVLARGDLAPASHRVEELGLAIELGAVSYTHLRAHETRHDL